jgi:hydrogenase maturation protein HypF
VRNTPEGVEVILEGEENAVDEYVRALWEDHPDAAVVTGVEIRRRSLSRRTFADFSVMESARSQGERHVLIPADLAVCEDCLAEMRDPRNRRYRYPFINCTNCGPRYTIIRALPYDRPQTTMSAFPMCPECRREYEDPADRRYHAQPNACPICGPKVRLCDPAGHILEEGDAAVERLIAEIAAGKLAAIKGIGGFHIACLPEDAPIRELRLRKHRPDKPFALMVRDLDTARGLADVSPEAERLLAGVQRPIALCPAKYRDAGAVSPLVAPGQKRLGILLPYTPLHHLVMEKFDALVMTSANISDAPIVSSDERAFSELSGVVDIVLCHNREIHTAIDDSVLLPGTVGGLRSIFLRRARGYVPNPMNLPLEAPNILAAGAQLKSTYALTRGKILFPGQYLGDMDRLETAAYYKKSLEHFMDLYGIAPEVLAFDKHPGYAATELARGLVEAKGDSHAVRLCPVQHHHAHLASVLLDNAYFDPVIGVLFDGTGYGEDGTLWGGEWLVGDARGFTRMGSFLPSRLPGGEKAIREPWRYALALLREALGAEEAKKVAESLWPEFRALIGPVLALAGTSGAAPVTTSCGRLFDGFSALLGLCPAATYDGQAAMALENAAEERAGEKGERGEGLNFGMEIEGDFVRLDWRCAVRSAATRKGEGTGRWAFSFHRGLARAVAEVCLLLKEKTGIDRVALSGGVWQNRTLLDLACEELRNRGLVALTHRDISPNDEGVSVGQALVAAYRFQIRV